MRYSSKLLSNGRWGIYIGHTLLATIGSQRTCHRVITVLNQRQYGQQLSEKHDLYSTDQNSGKDVKEKAELTVTTKEIAQMVG